METVKRISDLDPQLLPLVEQLFAVPITHPAATEIVLRTKEADPPSAEPTGSGEIPSYFNVLEGMSDEELREFDEILKLPVRLGRE